MSAPIPVILNPAAKSTQAAAREKVIRALSPAPELILTSAPGEATEIAAKLAKEGHPLVVAAGGDGTMNEVLAQMQSLPTVMAPITKIRKEELN